MRLGLMIMAFIVIGRGIKTTIARRVVTLTRAISSIAGTIMTFAMVETSVARTITTVTR